MAVVRRALASAAVCVSLLAASPVAALADSAAPSVAPTAAGARQVQPGPGPELSIAVAAIAGGLLAALVRVAAHARRRRDPPE